MPLAIFSVPVFFILFRESLETAVIVSVLLSLVSDLPELQDNSDVPEDDQRSPKRNSQHLKTRLTRQIVGGAATGLLIALALGFVLLLIYHWFTRDLFGENEDLWEGAFSLAASVMMLPMALGMLRLEKSKVKWQYTFNQAMSDKSGMATRINSVLFALPMVTVLREGVEGLIFVGGVSLGEPMSSIPLAALAGLACGCAVGVSFFQTAKSARLSTLLIVSSAFLLLMGAGLFSRSISAFERQSFVSHVGADVAESGDGPGSFDVRGTIWHLPYGNPENKQSGGWWSLANALVGWNNTASIGSISAYLLYWWTAIAVLVYFKWAEGRTAVCGVLSSKGLARAKRAAASDEESHSMLLPSGQMTRQDALQSVQGSSSSDELLTQSPQNYQSI